MTVIALAVIAAIGWGAGDFFGGDSSARGMPVFTVVALSELLGVFTLIPALAARPVPDLADPRLAPAVVAGVAVTVELSLIYSALGRGDSFATALVSALGTAIAVTAGLLTGDRLTAVIAAGLACAVLGGGISTWASPAAAGGAAVARTAMTCLGAAASVAVMLACLHTAGRLDPYWATAIEHASTALSAGLIAAARTRRAPRRGLPRSRQLAVLAVIAVAGAGGDLAYTAASRQGTLSVVSAVSSLYPLATIALGRMLRGGRATRVQLAGAALAVAGTVVLGAAAH
jgi:drug/metabolite transporter (DMT)-like permease